MDISSAVQNALQRRRDYLAAETLVRAAESSKRAAYGEALPGLTLAGDFGTIGTSAFSNHSTYDAAIGVRIPIFQGGRVRSDVEQADAVLRQREAQLADLRGRIEFEVRNAFLDVQAAAQQVEVATQTVKLADETLRQARDRFAAGVANNIEVIEAQQAVAAAHENFISTLNAHNIAKLLLARAAGVAEQQVKLYLGGTP
jgi:outer membrane protein TolC